MWMHYGVKTLGTLVGASLGYSYCNSLSQAAKDFKCDGRRLFITNVASGVSAFCFGIGITTWLAELSSTYSVFDWAPYTTPVVYTFAALVIFNLALSSADKFVDRIVGPEHDKSL